MKRYITTSQGQSVSEYAITIALVAVVGLGGLLLLSTGMKDQLVSFSARFTGQQSQSQQPQNIIVDLNNNAVGDANVPGAIPNTTTVNFQLSNGTAITLPNYPDSVSTSVETLGTNGTLNLMLANIDSMIAQLEASGMDQAKINQLKALSNQGHRMANLEGAIEKAYNTTSNFNDFLATEVTWDGTSLTIDELGNTHLGFNGIRPHSGMMDLDVLSNPPEVYYSNPVDYPRVLEALPETESFIDLYNQAKASGALEDPMLQDMVHTMASEVTILSSTIQDMTGDLRCVATNGNNFCIANGSNPPPENTPYDAWMSTYMISGATHMNSHGICRAGGTEDTGVQCQ